MYYKNKLGVNRELGKLKCAEQTIHVDAVVSVKSERVLLMKRTYMYARRVATSLGNVNQNTSGFSPYCVCNTLWHFAVLTLNFDTQISD